MPRSRKLLRITLVAVYNAGAVIAMLGVINWWHAYHLLRRPWESFEHVSARDGIPVSLGQAIASFEHDPSRRDLRSLPLSRPGTIRIGAFGDSYTFGDEVDAPQALPAQLQDLLIKDGFTNVEVINFGNSGH